MTKGFLTYWPFSLYYSLCWYRLSSCTSCLFQKLFYCSIWCYKYSKCTGCAVAIFTELLRSISVALMFLGSVPNSEFPFFCLSIVKKWVQTSFLYILPGFLLTLSRKSQCSPSTTCIFDAISLLLLQRLLSSQNLILFPFFHCSWIFLFTHLWLIWYWIVVDWRMGAML